MQRFNVNDYLSLRLIDDRTIIFVNDRSFIQCVHLLMNLPIKKIKNYEEIDSIDQASEELGEVYNGISPETEFWGHCSNLQAWAENNYDTRILHRNLAFPLLKKLTEVGDPTAKRVFKEEIVKRLLCGHDTVIDFLFSQGYLRFFNPEELETLFRMAVVESDSHYQALVESNFDERILHRDVAFPLLKKLSMRGNPNVKRIFKEEILKRFKSGHDTVIEYLIFNRYMDFFNHREFRTLIHETDFCPDFNIWNKMGNIFTKNAMHNKAIIAYEKSISLDPNNAKLWDNLGFAYLKRNQYNPALEAFKKAIQKAPDNVNIWNHLGMVYYEINSYDNALEAYIHVWKLRHKITKKNLSNFGDNLTKLGLKYIDIAEYDKAIMTFVNAVKLERDNSAYLLSLGLAYIKKGDTVKAMDAYDRALKDNPNHVNSWTKFSQDRTLERVGIKVKDVLEQSRKIFPFNDIFWYYLQYKNYIDRDKFYYDEYDNNEIFDGVGDDTEEYYYDSIVNNIKTSRRLKSKPIRLGGQRKG